MKKTVNIGNRGSTMFGKGVSMDCTVSGKVIVFKNPCTAPGDIRLLHAVSDVNRLDKLKHLVNVIVFSNKGSRPE